MPPRLHRLYAFHLTHLTAWLKVSALGLGGVGLFLLASSTGSFLTLPEAADVLIVVLAARSSRSGWFTTRGCWRSDDTRLAGALHAGAPGRRSLLRKRFTGERVGAWAAARPPLRSGGHRRRGLDAAPTPFKLLVLLSGALQNASLAFAAAVAVGGSSAISARDCSASWFGEAAFDYVRATDSRSGRPRPW